MHDLEDGASPGLIATALLCRRDADGRVQMNAAGKAEYIAAEVARAILQQSRTVRAGMGSHALLVPVGAIGQAGLGDVWRKMQFPIRTIGGEPHYDTATMPGMEILARLELAAGCSMKNAQGLAKAQGR